MLNPCNSAEERMKTAMGGCGRRSPLAGVKLGQWNATTMATHQPVEGGWLKEDGEALWDGMSINGPIDTTGVRTSVVSGVDNAGQAARDDRRHRAIDLIFPPTACDQTEEI